MLSELYRLAIDFVLSFSTLSQLTVVKIVWIAIVGDITPSDGISKAEKSRREQEALDHMCKLLGGGSRGTLLTNLCVCVYWCDCVVVML